MQVVDTMSNNLEWPPAIASWITKILIVGFPITLVITWLYEVTPQGLKRTGAIQEDTPENRKSGKRLNHIIIGALAITICFMLVERVFFAGNVDINKRQQASIAVLPFANMSSQEENGYFADGLTDQILDELANLSGLQVTARTSSFKFKDRNEDVRKIGEELDVNYVLEGSVQFDGRSNRIKIIAQLINASNGYHLWSETYEDDFDGIFGIQEDVSRKVASQLRIQLLPEEDKILSEKLTENSEAYKLFLESRQYSMQRNDKDLTKAIELLKKALELDPNFAEAHAELAFVYPQKHRYGDLSREERDRLREYHLNRALELAPEKPEVLRANALKIRQENGDSTKMIADLRKAIKIKPNYADAHYLLYQGLNWAEQGKTSIKSLERAVELDPLNEFFAVMLADNYHRYYGKVDKGIQILDRLIANDSSTRAMRSKALVLMQEPMGDLAEGYKLIYEAYKKAPDEFGNLTYNLKSSLGLDLLPLSEKFSNILQMRYPDNPITFSNISLPLYFKNESQKLLDLVDFWSAEKSLTKAEEIITRADIHIMKGNVKEARRIFEGAYPDLRKMEFEVDKLEFWTTYAELWYYAEILKLDNDRDKADLLGQKICEFYKFQIDSNKFLPKYQSNLLELDCYYFSDDTTSFVKAYENRYFTKKDRFHGGFGDIKMGDYQRFHNSREFKKLFERITEETHRHRTEVLAYLKKKGDWDPAWHKELGLE
jgi:TolB-like protein